MSRQKTALNSSPPYAVEQALKRLGANLRTARLRRNLTIENVARKIGAGERAVTDAEKGRPGTAAVVYLALLWTYDLLSQMEAVADPENDTEGLGSLTRRKRARTSGRTSGQISRQISPKGSLDNEF